MHQTMTSEYFFVGNSINKLVQVTTRDKQLLKLSKTCSTLIKIKTASYTWSQTAATVRFLSLTLSKTRHAGI